MTGGDHQGNHREEITGGRLPGEFIGGKSPGSPITRGALAILEQNNTQSDLDTLLYVF